ncbi:dethiobiotin synthase [Bariatricus sp. SGI.154]|uniref:dethiobiotin synthase n=1 Tax=Bariatricus sp. SGI.154 TaxID=3420549 RepID=UPI003CFFD333
MGKGLFITATGTDVGKTYVTALIVKKLKEAGYHAGYYKAALSGAECIADSDAGYVKKVSGITQEDDTLISYLYKEAVSPHLAARIEDNPVELQKVTEDFRKVTEEYEYVTVEGSGGIVCPIRWDETCRLLLEDVIRALELDTVVVADAGLGTINAVVLTVEYLRQHGISVKGVILNHYTGDVMQEDNVRMIEMLAQVPILAKVKPQDTELSMDIGKLVSLFA